MCRGCPIFFTALSIAGSGPLGLELFNYSVIIMDYFLMHANFINMDYFLIHADFISMHYYLMHYNFIAQVARYDVLK